MNVNIHLRKFISVIGAVMAFNRKSLGNGKSKFSFYYKICMCVMSNFREKYLIFTILPSNIRYPIPLKCNICSQSYTVDIEYFSYLDYILANFSSLSNSIFEKNINYRFSEYNVL